MLHAGQFAIHYILSRANKPTASPLSESHTIQPVQAQVVTPFKQLSNYA